MIRLIYLDLNSDKGCKTVSGPRPNNRCTFPFKYKRVLYWKCTTEDNFGIPWCATKVWSDGRVLGSDYGNCGPGCALGNDGINLSTKHYRNAVINLLVCFSRNNGEWFLYLQIL